MNSAGTKVIKNASVLMISQMVTWGLSLLSTIFLPAYLGATVMGEFVIAGSIWVIMGMLIGFGMDTLLTKEIARYPERTPILVGTALVLRCLFFLVSCGMVAIYLRLMNYPSNIANIVWIIGVYNLITQLAFVCQAALQGLEAMQYISIASIAGKIVNTILVIAAVVLGYGVYTVGFVYITSSIVFASLMLLFLMRFYKPQLNLNMASTLRILKASSPYLMSSVGLIVYGQVDVLIIASLVDTKELGWYGAAWQLLGTLVFIPVIFTTAVFPILTRTHANAPDSLPRILRKTFDLMLLISVPLGFGLFVIAGQAVVLLFGHDFTQSGPILALMGIELIFTYQDMLIGQYLISTDRQNKWTVIMLIAAAITVPLDLVLVPWCQQAFGNGAMGGAISYIITESAMMVAGIVFLPKGSLGWSNVRVGTRIIIAGLGMIASIWWLRDTFIVIPIIVGAIAYIALIAVLRIVPSEDIALLKQMGQGLLRKLRRSKTEPVGITGV